MAPSSIAKTPDGRHLRSARHRDAVVRAVLKEIMATGTMPTVTELAKLAGVSRRTVFRLFDDMETVHLAAIKLQRAEVIQRFPPPMPAGQPLSERVEELIEHRAKVYEHIMPLRKVGERFRDESEAVRRDLEQSHQEFSMHTTFMLNDGLPRAAGEREVVVRALVLATSFSTWRSLRDEQCLSAAEATAVVTCSVARLLGISK